MTDLQYDVNSTMLDMVLSTVAPVAQRVVSDWTAPPPLPEPTEAVFEADGRSCTDSVWFDKDVVREITHRADVDPTFALGGWNIQLEIKDEVSDQTNVEHYSIEPDYPLDFNCHRAVCTKSIAIEVYHERLALAPKHLYRLFGCMGQVPGGCGGP